MHIHRFVFHPLPGGLLDMLHGTKEKRKVKDQQREQYLGTFEEADEGEDSEA